MHKSLSFFKKSVRPLILVAVILSSCQKDPVLEELNNGQPIITPKTKASVSVIQINSHPDLDLIGNTWDTIDSTQFDTLGRPDIFFNISPEGSNSPVLWSQNSHFSNCGPNDSVPYFLLSPYQVEPFGTTIRLNIYDYELPDSTLMESMDFYIGQYPDSLNPYPDYITQTKNGYSVTIGVKWEE